ncbi:hypothetical protein [Allocoleopsis sp.]|uniref:hypothetical protein n=1 Tax=Allocoleopsis sp. TaxID=3088169 RepID=UPI002FCFF34F
MTVLSITDIFGPGASQTAANFTIAKSDLPTLTAKPDNNGEQLLVAIILAAANKLTDANRTNNDDQRVTLAYGGQTVYPGSGGKNESQHSFTITLHKPVPAEVVDADDY